MTYDETFQKQYGYTWKPEDTISLIPDVLNKLPKEPVIFDTFKVKRTLKLSDIRKRFEENDVNVFQGIEDFPIFHDTILELKAEQIKEAMKELGEMILKRYQEIIDNKILKIPLNEYAYYEQIIQDYTYYDLVPGDTAISFEIVTIRRLVQQDFQI